MKREEKENTTCQLDIYRGLSSQGTFLKLLNCLALLGWALGHNHGLDNSNFLPMNEGRIHLIVNYFLPHWHPTKYCTKPPAMICVIQSHQSMVHHTVQFNLKMRKLQHVQFQVYLHSTWHDIINSLEFPY